MFGDSLSNDKTGIFVGFADQNENGMSQIGICYQSACVSESAMFIALCRQNKGSVNIWRYISCVFIFIINAARIFTVNSCEKYIYLRIINESKWNKRENSVQMPNRRMRLISVVSDLYHWQTHLWDIFDKMIFSDSHDKHLRIVQKSEQRSTSEHVKLW